MNITRALKLGGPLIVILALVGMTTAYALTSIPPRPPQAQGQSYSVHLGDPLTLHVPGLKPADILGIDAEPLVACQNLGLICDVPGASDDIQALSFGWDFLPYELPMVQFSVGPGSVGTAGTEVNLEASCPQPEPQADVFESVLDGSNIQDLDGDGQACSSNQGFGLILFESPVSDNLDALERDPCQFVDLDCDGVLENPILLALSPGSPSLSYFRVTAADILITGLGGYNPRIWASGTADLGLIVGDVIDALCIRENGNGVYDHEDEVLFSLAPGSPSLSGGLSPGDLLRPHLRLGVPAGRLGLERTDDVDAALCTIEYSFADIHLPLVFK